MMVQRFLRWLLFLLRNGFRKPEYPFADDFVDKPLKLAIGPWGATMWKDAASGDMYSVVEVDRLSQIAESMVLNMCHADYQEKEAAKERHELENHKVPKAIGFWPDCQTDKERAW